MSESIPELAPSADIRVAEAAAWRVHLSEIGMDSTPDFEAWLVKPGSYEAWARVSNVWSYFGEQANESDVIAVRQKALSDAKREHTRRGRFRDWRAWVQPVAAVAVLAVIGCGTLLWLTRPLDYVTALGERLNVTLADGSRISLDSGSEVTVHYTHDARELHLLRGQARFDVSHDVERPFYVLAGNQKVIATGTAFNVDLTGPNVLVTLIEGHVVVLNKDPPESLGSRSQPSQPVAMHAGQQLMALPNGVPKLAVANIQRVIAWTNGQLMFDNDPLSTVVARVNRYTNRPIVVEDPKIASMRISGVFNAGDSAEFVDLVTEYLPLRAETRESGVVILVAKR